MKNSKENNSVIKSLGYHELATVLGQLMPVVASLTFSDGFQFFIVSGIRVKIRNASCCFLEAARTLDQEAKKQMEKEATELLDEAVSWLQGSLAKWFKVHLINHFECLLGRAENSFGVGAPEVVEVSKVLGEFKKTVSGTIEDFSGVVEKAKNIDKAFSQMESMVSKRKALARSAEYNARRAKERAEKDREYSAYASMLETFLMTLENFEEADVQ